MRRLMVLALSLAAHAAWGAEYRSELSFGYLAGDISVSGSSTPGYTPPPVGEPTETPPIEPPPVSSTSADDDYSGWQVGGEVFFAPVDTSHGPRRLAPFMDRASSVGGRYSELETDDSDVETESWEAFTRIVVNNWVLEGAFGQSEVDSGGADEDVDLYRAALGYYVAQYTQVRLGYDNEDVDSVDYERWAVDVTHVQQLESGMTWQAKLLYGDVQGDLAIGDDDGSDIEAEFSWFFNEAFGVGANYRLAKRDASGDTDAWNLWTNYFPTDKISLSLSYFSEENDDIDAENEGVVFEAKYRL